MKISEIMNENCIVVGIKAQNKRQLLQELAQKASEITQISERTIFDSLLERENLGPPVLAEQPPCRMPVLPKPEKFAAFLQNSIRRLILMLWTASPWI